MSVSKHLIYSFIAISLSSCSSTKQNIVGNDRDSHGCIASAGYTWSKVQKNCIRLFETGIRVESLKSPNESAFIVFSPDSQKVELFFSNKTESEILDRRTLPDGSFAWNIEDDDTKNVQHINDFWTISQRGLIQYTQPDDSQVLNYEGILPAADCPGIRYQLTIKAPKHSGDGTFNLVQTYLDAQNGKNISYTTSGRRYTLRGDANNINATVWQLVPSNGKTPINFLVENDGKKLTLLNDKQEKINSDLNYSIDLVQ